MRLQIGDYGMSSLKKFCKIFNGYDVLTPYSAPEVWGKHFQSDDQQNPDYDARLHFFNQPKVDIYSYAMIIWELETGRKPFGNESRGSIYNLLKNNKVRPQIPPETNQCLALLIRRCWQDQAEKRPTVPKILESLKIAEFSSTVGI